MRPSGSSSGSANTSRFRLGEPAVVTSPAQHRANREHYPALDGLRGIAILLVMMFHFGWAKPAVGYPAKLLVFVTNFGWTGVDLFFVLSGFLITGILLDSKKGAHYFKNFYARRVLRIFPLYYGVLVLTLIVLPRIVSYDSPDMQRLLRSQGWLWAYSANISVALRHGEWIWNPDWLRLGMLWSLAVEEHFYLVWPLLVFLLPQRGLLRVSLAMVILTPVARAVALASGVAADTVYCLTVFRADDLAMGGLLAAVLRTPEIMPRVRPYTRWAFWAGVGVVALLTARRRFFRHLDPSVETVGFAALACTYGSVLFSAVTSAPASRLSRVLSHPKIAFFGKYSYGAYLLHELLRPAFMRFFPVEGLERLVHSEVAAFLLHALFGTATTFACAVASFELYEKRFLRLKRFF
jgi:peptidoglycan/LPS O-acetylase OafA/YrhL